MANMNKDIIIARIIKNEERLDDALLCIHRINLELNKMKINQQSIQKLSKYYGSKNWFKDKQAYENGSIPKIKAGVLSEDSIWNMLDEYKEVIFEMKKIVDNYLKENK